MYYFRFLFLKQALICGIFNIILKTYKYYCNWYILACAYICREGGRFVLSYFILPYLIYQFYVNSPPIVNYLYLLSLVSKISLSIYFIPYCCYFLMSCLYWHILFRYIYIFICNNNVPTNKLLS